MKSNRPQVLSHCPYCALNCGIGLDVDDDGVLLGQTRWKKSPLTAGAVCSKGSTAWEQVQHGDRITMPLVRRDGVLVETGWEEALDLAAEGFDSIRDRHGDDANGVLSGGSLTNEKAYLMGKFARLALRTRHIDYNGRFCMVSAGSANLKAFGLDRAMTPLDQVEHADVVVVVGANLSDAYPVMLPKAINAARKRGARVVVIDPRFGRWVQDDDLKIQLRPGTDGVFFLGLLNEIDRQHLLDVDYIDDRTTGFDEALRSARPWTAEVAGGVSDVAASTIAEVATLIGTAERCMILHARGPEQQTMGTSNVLAMINVALAVGLPGRPGCGIDMLTGQRNGQGGREWGQRCNQLPAGRSIADPEHRATVAERWGVTAEEIPGIGATYVEILQMAGRGEIKGLLSISNNMSISAPDLDRVEEQMGQLEHVVVIDPFLSEAAARHATIVLPGTTFAEEEGTITTIEGRVVRCDQAVAPVPLRSDIDILRNLARRLGAGRHFGFSRGREVFEEMRRVSAEGPNDYAGITWDRARDGVFWPCPNESHPGTPQLYTERFAHPDGRARFHSVEHVPPPVVVDDEYPLVLTTGRLLAQYLSGNQTKRIPAQQRLAPGPFVELHPDAAAELELEPEDRVVLRSRQGRSVVPWKPNDRLRRDTVFMPYHWRECNVLVAADLDPTSKIPGFKYTPISVQPLSTEVVVSSTSSIVEGSTGSAGPSGVLDLDLTPIRPLASEARS